MKYSLLTRLIHLKHQWVQLLVWLLLPFILTWIIMSGFSQVQSEAQVPVGIVLEEETPLVLELYEKIKTEPLIRASLLTETVARNNLLKHDLDSVFIIHDGYQQNIKQDDRNELITGLNSDLSFAYTPTSEIIMSFVQEHAVRSKAVHTVEDLIAEHNSSLIASTTDIIDKSKEIQENQDFLTTSFVFNEQSITQQNQQTLFIKPWNFWAISTLLTTLFIFDWVIKEKRISLQPRFKLMRVSFKAHLLHNLLFYTFLLYIFDIITAILFMFYFNQELSLKTLGVLLSYRFSLNISAFLLALCFKKTQLFYTVSFTIALIITIVSRAVFPINSVLQTYNWLSLLNPLDAFLQGDFLSIWLIAVTGILILWYLRKERLYA